MDIWMDGWMEGWIDRKINPSIDLALSIHPSIYLSGTMTVSMFKRFVEPGRLALITFGPCTGKMYGPRTKGRCGSRSEEMGVSRGTYWGRPLHNF